MFTLAQSNSGGQYEIKEERKSLESDNDNEEPPLQRYNTMAFHESSLSAKQLKINVIM